MLAIFLDLETTGLDPTQHQAIDLALKVLTVNGGQEVGQYQTLIKPSEEAWSRRNLQSIEINGYTYEALAGGKNAQCVGQEIIALFQTLKVERGKAIFICQNPSFDRSFFTQIIDVYTQEKLNWPYHWLDFASMYWALFTKNLQQNNQLFPMSINLSKNEIARCHDLPPESCPHLAANGVNHLIDCYKQVVGFPKQFIQD